MAIGWGQRRTVLILYCSSGVMGVAAILFSLDMIVETLILMVIAGTLIFVFLDNEIVDKSENVTKGRKLLQEWPKNKNEIVKRKDASIVVKDDKKGKRKK